MGVDAFRVNLVVTISFIITMISYYFAYNSKGTLRSAEKMSVFFSIIPQDRINKNQRSKWNAFAILSIALVLWSLWVYKDALGSWSIALLRFYTQFDTLKQISLAGGFSLKFTIAKKIISASTLSLLFLSLAKKQKGVSSILFWILVTLLTIYGFASGSRGMTIAPLTALLFVDYYFKVKKQEWLPVSVNSLVFGGFAILLFVLLGNVRSEKFYNFEDFFNRAGQLNEIVVESEKSYDRENNIRFIDHVLKVYPAWHDYLYAHTFYSILTNFIPRKYWEEKPIGFGRITALQAIGTLTPTPAAVNNTSASFSAGIAGEGYASGGMVGVVVFSVIFGAFSGFVSRCSVHLLRSNHIMPIITSFLFLKWSFSFVRGGMLDNFLGSFYIFIILFLVTVSIRKLYKTFS